MQISKRLKSFIRISFIRTMRSTMTTLAQNSSTNFTERLSPDSGDQLKWTTAFSREAVAEYIVGSSYELPELVLQFCVSSV